MDRLRILGGKRTLLALGIAWMAASAAVSAALAGDVTVQKVFGELRAPCGVAVRPDGGSEASEVFVVDRGSGRVVKLLSNTPNTSTDAIAGFPVRAANDNTSSSPGIHSLAFLDHTRLVVAGCDKSRTPFLRLYELSDSNAPLKADEYKQSVELPGISGHPNEDHRSFHDLTRTQPNDRVADMLVVAASDENGAGSLWKVAVRANTLGEIASFGVASSSDNAETVSGLAVTNNGYIVVAGGSPNDTGEADLLKFVNPADGQVGLQIKTELQRIVGLAYSPKSGNLYAAGSASGGKLGGGVYRIDDASQSGKPACKAVKIADVARPTALAFGPDDTLYVTALGESSEDNKNSGLLFKLTGEL